MSHLDRYIFLVYSFLLGGPLDGHATSFSSFILVTPGLFITLPSLFEHHLSSRWRD
ncbi:hypothetical protein HanRHA438_Chr17g0834011 [Helianthus annuus]|nr:hypothetical protein HanRHA438_Chr17g0834011 [Helianthus annuus]